MYCLDVSDSLLLSLKEIRISERLTALTIITWAFFYVQYLILLAGADLWKNSLKEINDDKEFPISIGIIQDPPYRVPQGLQC